MTEVPGLAFIGPPWQLDQASATFIGVARDAEHLAGELQRLPGNPASDGVTGGPCVLVAAGERITQEQAAHEIRRLASVAQIAAGALDAPSFEAPAAMARDPRPGRRGWGPIRASEGAAAAVLAGAGALGRRRVSTDWVQS